MIKANKALKEFLSRLADLTEEQQEDIKGEQGPRGIRGEPIFFTDLTEDQKEELKLKPVDMGASDWSKLIGPAGSSWY